jgi:hypothetical protein
MNADTILRIFDSIIFLCGGIYVIYTQRKFLQVAKKYTKGQNYRLYQFRMADVSEADKRKIKSLHFQRLAVFILLIFLFVVGFIVRSAFK